MSTYREGNLPLRSNIAYLYISSILIAVLVAVVSIAGLRYRSLIYPDTELLSAFVPNDAVNLFIGVPVLLGSIWLARRGKLIGLLCWIGALFFEVYNEMAYVFAMPPGWAFLAHLILAVSGVYSLIALVANTDAKKVQQRLAGNVPEIFAGGVLAGLGLLLFLRVIAVVVDASGGGEALARSELAVNISDFLTTPAWFMGGLLLWRHKALGYVAGLGLLFQGSMLFIALIIYLLLQPLFTGASLALTDILVIFAMGLVCFVPFTLFLRGVLVKTGHSKSA